MARLDIDLGELHFTVALKSLCVSVSEFQSQVNVNAWMRCFSSCSESRHLQQRVCSARHATPSKERQFENGQKRISQRCYQLQVSLNSQTRHVLPNQDMVVSAVTSTPAALLH